jgi:hypothetical protein
MNALIRYWNIFFRLCQCRTFLLNGRKEKKQHMFRSKGFQQFCCIYSTSERDSWKGHLKVWRLFLQCIKYIIWVSLNTDNEMRTTNTEWIIHLHTTILCNYSTPHPPASIHVYLHCKKSWRSSSTPASGDAGPIHTGVEKSFRNRWRKFYYKYRTFLTFFTSVKLVRHDYISHVELFRW